ncbi:YlxR family protein [Candidatus Binatus sp.]|uniref:YlxR family protein n=1 Tax=Candidatus Binatus sp. TaxID=2811406 RepID=UPI00351D0219
MPEKKRKMPEESHKVERTCIGCMKKDAKAAMVRIALVEDSVVADCEGKRAGRGAYLHRTNECALQLVYTKVKVFSSLRRRIDRGERLRIAEAVKLTLDRSTKVE